MSSSSMYDAGRILRAIEGPATERMRPFRETRNLVLREYAGPWYGQCRDIYGRPEEDKRPVNLLYQFIRTYLPNLVGPETKVKVSPRAMGMAGQATIRELLLNDVLREMRFSDIWQTIVLDALTGGLGIARTGIKAGGSQFKADGEMFDLGQPYVVRVDLDDFVRDPNSRHYTEDRWRAFRYRVQRSELLELGVHDPDLVKRLSSVESLGATRGESDEIQGIRDTDPVDDVVELWDVLYYDRGKVIEGTLAGESPIWLTKPQEYEGRQGAPLHLVSLQDLPNNAMPVNPSAAILDLHLGMAGMGQKMIRQALRTKMAYIYRDQAGQDTAEELESSGDQDSFKGDPQSVTAVKHGGMIPELVPAFQWAEDQANKATAMHLLAGSEDPSQTATVGTFMQGNASVLLNHWRGRVNSACRDVVNAVAWYIDTDPMLQRTVQHRLDNGVTIDLMYDGATKEGAFTDFLWNVQPYVETTMDPSLKLRRLSELMTALPAFAQTVMQLGGDMSKAIEMLADQYQIPELADIFPTAMLEERAMMMMQMAGAPGQGAPKAAGGVRPAAGNRPIDQTRSDLAVAGRM